MGFKILSLCHLDIFYTTEFTEMYIAFLEYVIMLRSFMYYFISNQFNFIIPTYDGTVNFLTNLCLCF